MKKIILLILPILIIFGACKKYPDGPIFSFNTKKHRIVNSWIFDKVFENGVDRTADYQYAYTNFIIVTKKDNTYTLSYDINNTFSYNESGTWDFDKNKTHFVLTNAQNNGNSSMGNSWEILKLQEKEFWVKTTTVQGANLEIHFFPINP
jgi:hypothetical protein